MSHYSHHFTRTDLAVRDLICDCLKLNEPRSKTLIKLCQPQLLQSHEVHRCAGAIGYTAINIFTKTWISIQGSMDISVSFIIYTRTGIHVSWIFMSHGYLCLMDILRGMYLHGLESES